MNARLLAAVVSAVLALSGCGGKDGPGKVGLYDRAPVPAVPDRTQAIGPAGSALLSDGTYWAELIGVNDSSAPSLTFELTQALFAQTCIDELGADECTNDYGVIAEPHQSTSGSQADLVSVTVVGENQQNLAITAAELASLIAGNAPGTPAPEGYAYVEFPFLLTVQGGKIVEAHQIWVP